MSKKKKQPSAAPSPTLHTLSLPSPLSVSFDPNTSIKVAVAPPEKALVRMGLQLAILLAAFAVLVVIWSLLFYRYVVERAYSPQPISLSGTPLSVAMAYPARVAFGDEAELDLIVANLGNDSFTGNVVVSFEGAHLLPNETGAVKVESLSSKESKTYRLKFALLPKASWWSGGAVRTSLQAYSGNRQLSSVNGADIPIARLPYARTLILWLRNSVLTGAVALLLWEVVRKRFFGWEAK
jgi:hypothetical protein